MTGNKCLLDTTIIVHAFRSNNNISEKLDSVQEIHVSVTAIGELFYGAYKSPDPVKHIAQMKSFLLNYMYGSIKAALATKGKLIPENDICIGAASLQYNLPLYTTDAHFNEIDGIILF